MTQSQLQLYLQEQFIGKDKTRMSVQNDIFKTIKERWNEKLGYVPERPMALITVHDPDEPKILSSIGCSEPNDLLVNIFGASLGGMLNGGGNVLRNISDISGVVRTVRFNSSGSTFSTTDGAAGFTMAVGRGGFGANRTDFQLSDPFVVAPESNAFSITPGGWLSGSQSVVVNGLLAGVTTSDVIGECALYARWSADQSPPITIYGTFMLSHDIAGASFSSGQNVNVTYTWSIT